MLISFGAGRECPRVSQNAAPGVDKIVHCVERFLHAVLRRHVAPCWIKAGALPNSLSPNDAEDGAVMEHPDTSDSLHTGQYCSHREIVNRATRTSRQWNASGENP